MLTISLILLFTASYLSFGWAYLFFFRQTSRSTGKTLMQIIGPLSVGMSAFELLKQAYDVWRLATDRHTALDAEFAQMVSAQRLGVGIAMAHGGLMLFWFSVKASRKAGLSFIMDAKHSDKVLRHGPYNYVRHPFYTSYLLTWGAAYLLTLGSLSLVSFVVMAGFFIYASQKEEEALLAGPTASEYRAYRARTGRFFPKII